MKKILIIPHHPGLSKIKIRLVEIAKALSHNYEIFLFHCKSVQGDYTLRNRIRVTLEDFFKSSKLYKRDNLNIVEFPTLHRPVYLAQKFNRFWLRHFFKNKGISVVISGCHYLFPVPEKRQFKYIVDLADLPSAGTRSDFVGRYTGKEVRKSDAVTAVSLGLVDYVYENYRKEALFIPNGADIKKIQSIKQVDVDNIRRKHNLENKWIIGYIGNIGSWVNVQLAVNAFKIFKKDMPEAILIWIGPGLNLEKLRNKYSTPDIIFVGGIDENLEPYFKLLDLALLPSKKCLFQDLAFHIKLIEYTAARKFVISTPLEESIRLNFPNIIFAEENEISWVDAMKRAKNMVWNREWDSLVDDYDWSKISQKLVSIIES